MKNGEIKNQKNNYIKAVFCIKPVYILIFNILIYLFSNGYSILNNWIISPSLILFSFIFLNLNIGFSLTLNILFVSLKLSYFL